MNYCCYSTNYNAPFINYISKMNNVLIENAEDLDVAMPMYNLLEYSENYRKATGSLWNYCRDESSDLLLSEVALPVKYFSNFWRILNIPLIDCEIELILTWSKNCVLADITPASNLPIELEFQITDTILYVPVVTLSTENDKKLLEQLNQDLKELKNGINTDH